MKKLTHEEFGRKLESKGVKITPLEEYIIDNGWIMIRISYLDYYYIEEILDEYLLERDDNDEYIG